MPAARRYRLDDDDIAALFTGTTSTRPALAARASAASSPPPPPRHCQACGEVREDLLSFRGDRDWYPSIALEAPVRRLVRDLRARYGTPWVTLCDRCVDLAAIHLEEA